MRMKSIIDLFHFLLVISVSSLLFHLSHPPWGFFFCWDLPIASQLLLFTNSFSPSHILGNAQGHCPGKPKAYSGHLILIGSFCSWFHFDLGLGPHLVGLGAYSWLWAHASLLGGMPRGLVEFGGTLRRQTGVAFMQALLFSILSL